MEPAQRGRELVLAPPGALGLDDLELPSVLGDLTLGEPFPAGVREQGDEGDIDRARRPEPRPGRRVATGHDRTARLDREHPQRRLEEIEPTVDDEPRGVDALQFLTEIFGDEPEELAAECELGVRVELDRGIHHEAALAGREGRHVGPPARQVEAHRGAGPEVLREVAALHGAIHHSATFASSPRRSIRTPRTLRFIPCTPRA